MPQIRSVSGLIIRIGPFEAKEPTRLAQITQNLHSENLKLSYLSHFSADSAEIWFVASPHDYIGTLYS